jgi:hypothetical protein
MLVKAIKALVIEDEPISHTGYNTKEPTSALGWYSIYLF